MFYIALTLYGKYILCLWQKLFKISILKYKIFYLFLLKDIQNQGIFELQLQQQIKNDE